MDKLKGNKLQFRTTTTSKKETLFRSERYCVASSANWKSNQTNCFSGSFVRCVHSTLLCKVVFKKREAKNTHREREKGIKKEREKKVIWNRQKKWSRPVQISVTIQWLLTTNISMIGLSVFHLIIVMIIIGLNWTQNNFQALRYTSTFFHIYPSILYVFFYSFLFPFFSNSAL